MIFLKLFLTFFKVGLFTVGGGYAMLPFIQSEVLRQGWVSEELIINFIAVSESTPGPFAINIATYIGSVMGKEYGLWGTIFGSFCATLGTVLPSFIVILIVARMYERFKTNKYVKAVMTGLKPAVVGLIGAAIISMILSVFFPGMQGLSKTIVSAVTDIKFYISLITATVMTVLSFKKVHPIIIILISAAVGIASGYIFNLSI